MITGLFVFLPVAVGVFILYLLARVMIAVSMEYELPDIEDIEV